MEVSANKSPPIQAHSGERSNPLQFQLSASSLEPLHEVNVTVGQNVGCPHTASPHENWGVNPVSNKLGLTPVNPYTSAANATTQNEISRLLTCTQRPLICVIQMHTNISTHSIEESSVSLSSCVNGRTAILTAEGLLFQKTYLKPFTVCMSDIL